jgi:uncharacterized protein (DUF2236 family)
LIDLWDREGTNQVYFFEEHEMSKLHRAAANWHALTDIDGRMTPNMKAQFLIYWKKQFKEEIKE